MMIHSVNARKVTEEEKFLCVFCTNDVTSNFIPISFTGVGCIDVALPDKNRKRIEHLDARHE